LSGAITVSDIKLSLRDDCLITYFSEAKNILSWAPFNGGLIKSNYILNWQNSSFAPDELSTLFKEKIKRLGISPHSVGMLTSAKIKNYQKLKSEIGRYEVYVIATVGLDNTRTVGDVADVGLENGEMYSGTINLIVACNALPDLQGLVEAVQVATMAKAKALIDMGVTSKKSSNLATGTGTDCIAIAASGQLQENYCGMHTALGQLIGDTVYQVIKRAIPFSL